MGTVTSFLAKQKIEPELHLRFGGNVFGVSFTNLEHARAAARQINEDGREVEIFERDSGQVIERFAGKPKRA